MNKPLVSTYSFIEGIPVNIKAPLRINKGAVRAKFLSKLYFENSINLGTVDNGPITDLDWKTYLKTAALHVQSLSIAIQIKTDTFSANHKYLAHQVAVLYVLHINIAIDTGRIVSCQVQAYDRVELQQSKRIMCPGIRRGRNCSITRRIARMAANHNL
eukprot:NODE_726_length_4776_cov_0.427106.p3 type:complete len:158 gc:universal NODE_726_length_4776_cov_0.427106:2230-2703(+)